MAGIPLTSLQITLLGSLRLADGRGVVLELPTRAAQSLLVYLLLNRGRLFPRDLLAGLFWGESPESRARASLSTTLWRLRQVLEPAGVPRGAYLRVSHAGDLGFRVEGAVSLDVDVFERGTRVLRGGRPLQVDTARELSAGIEVYTGDLLPGFYEEWVLRERERLRLLFIRALYELMRYHAGREELEESLAYGRRLVVADPLREEVQREMMRLYARSGQRAMALRQYESCRAALRAELGVAPLPETTALFREVRRAVGDVVSPGRVSGGAALPGAGGPGTDHAAPEESAYRAVRRAMHQLRLALQRLDDARRASRTEVPTPAARPHSAGAERAARARPQRVRDGAAAAFRAGPPEGV